MPVTSRQLSQDGGSNLRNVFVRPDEQVSIDQPQIFLLQQLLPQFSIRTQVFYYRANSYHYLFYQALLCCLYFGPRYAQYLLLIQWGRVSFGQRGQFSSRRGSQGR